MSDSLRKLGVNYIYLGQVQRIIDGDTYDVMIDVGFRIFHSIRIRLRGIDTPEIRGGTQGEYDHAIQATRAVESVIPPGTQILVHSVKTAVYNRWEADITFLDETGKSTDLKGYLISKGMSRRAEY